jgi:hypothetical protein
VSCEVKKNRENREKLRSVLLRRKKFFFYILFMEVITWGKKKAPHSTTGTVQAGDAGIQWVRNF